MFGILPRSIQFHFHGIRSNQMIADGREMNLVVMVVDKLSDRALFSVEEPEGTSIVIGTARAGHFSWRTENGFHDLDSVMRWLQSHPDYTICDEYGTIKSAEEFKQVLDWCGTYISS